jgi:chlorobactene glucosyltransferase
MYTGWQTLWPGIAKNLSHMLGGPLATISTALIALLLAWSAVLLAPIDFLACSSETQSNCFAGFLALSGTLGAFALHVAGAIYFGLPFWYGALFPVGYTIGAIIAFDSLRWRWTGRVRWKGRIYQ